MIQNLTLEGGGRTFFTLPANDAPEGGTLLHYLNRLDGFSLGHPDGAIAAPARTYTPISFVFHAGSRPRDRYGRPNPFDLTAFVPSLQISRLRANWVTSGNDVMDDVVTISSAVMRFTVSQVLGTELEVMAEMAMQDVRLPPGTKAMVPEWLAEDYPHGATASDYATERNIQGGAWLKRVSLIEQDGTATRALRAGDEVTAVKLSLPRGDVELYKAFADQMMLDVPPGNNLEDDDGAADFQGNVPRGILVLDLRPHTGPDNPWGVDYGLNAVSLNVGDLKLGLTITTQASNDHSGILLERYLPLLPGQAFA